MAVASARPGRIARWFERSAPHLRVVFLLSGAALACGYAAILALLGSLLLGVHPTPVRVGLLIMLIIVLPSLPGLVAQLRAIEIAAATPLLRVDVGQPPTPSSDWASRSRTVIWFWLHLITGILTIIAIVPGIALGSMLIVQPLLVPPGRQIMGIPWAVTTGGWRDLGLVAGGVLFVLAGLLLLIILGSALAGSAPGLLGPTPGERIAQLDASTTTLLEHNRLARELHDSIGHALSVIIVQSAAGRRQLQRDADLADRSFQAVEGVATSALVELDGVLGLLTAGDSGSTRQPTSDLSSLTELIRVVRSAGHAVALNSDLDDPTVLAAIPSVTSREAYRIIQEGLTNAMKHAPGEPVSLTVTTTDRDLAIDLENSIPPSRRDRRNRSERGIAGIRERTKILGGRMDYTLDHHRCSLSIMLPLALGARR